MNTVQFRLYKHVFDLAICCSFSIFSSCKHVSPTGESQSDLASHSRPEGASSPGGFQGIPSRDAPLRNRRSQYLYGKRFLDLLIPALTIHPNFTEFDDQFSERGIHAFKIGIKSAEAHHDGWSDENLNGFSIRPPNTELKGNTKLRFSQAGKNFILQEVPFSASMVPLFPEDKIKGSLPQMGLLNEVTVYLLRTDTDPPFIYGRILVYKPPREGYFDSFTGNAIAIEPLLKQGLAYPRSGFITALKKQHRADRVLVAVRSGRPRESKYLGIGSLSFLEAPEWESENLQPVEDIVREITEYKLSDIEWSPELVNRVQAWLLKHLSKKEVSLLCEEIGWDFYNLTESHLSIPHPDKVSRESDPRGVEAALWLAIEANDHLTMIRIFEEYGITDYDIARKTQDTQISRHNRILQPSKYSTVLGASIEYGCSECVDWLLAKGADPTMAVPTSTLHGEVEEEILQPSDPLTLAAERNDARTTKLLLLRGADPSRHWSDVGPGESKKWQLLPLLTAYEYEAWEVFTLLLKGKAKPHQKALYLDSQRNLSLLDVINAHKRSDRFRARAQHATELIKDYYLDDDNDDDGGDSPDQDNPDASPVGVTGPCDVVSG